MSIGDKTETPIMGEAAGRYLAGLPEERRLEHQQAVNAFIRWYNGAGLPVNALTALAVSQYAEQEAQRDSEFGNKVEPLKGFLGYLRKQGWVNENLSAGIQVKKTKARKTWPVSRGKHQPMPMSRARYDEIKEELAGLRARRAELTKAVTIAAADKDFRENAPFHAAREQKGHVEGRILEMEETLASAVITGEAEVKANTVCIGDTLLLVVLPSQQEMRCKLVNPKEVAPSRGLISIASPVGKAAIGRCEGDVIEVHAPAGKMRYCLKRIER